MLLKPPKYDIAVVGLAKENSSLEKFFSTHCVSVCVCKFFKGLHTTMFVHRLSQMKNTFRKHLLNLSQMKKWKRKFPWTQKATLCLVDHLRGANPKIRSYVFVKLFTSNKKEKKTWWIHSFSIVGGFACIASMKHLEWNFRGNFGFVLVLSLLTLYFYTLTLPTKRFELHTAKNGQKNCKYP